MVLAQPHPAWPRAWRPSALHLVPAPPGPPPVFGAWAGGFPAGSILRQTSQAEPTAKDPRSGGVSVSPNAGSLSDTLRRQLGRPPGGSGLLRGFLELPWSSGW